MRYEARQVASQRHLITVTARRHQGREECFPQVSPQTLKVLYVIIILIKGHSLRRACLQTLTNTQNSKPRPPTANARRKGRLKIKQNTPRNSASADHPPQRSYIPIIQYTLLSWTLYCLITIEQECLHDMGRMGITEWHGHIYWHLLDIFIHICWYQSDIFIHIYLHQSSSSSKGGQEILPIFTSIGHIYPVVFTFIDITRMAAIK